MGTIHFMFKERFGDSPNGCGIRVVQRIFPSNKNKKVPTNRRKDSIQVTHPRMRRLEAFMYLVAQNLKPLFKNPK
jgi:hypothetical protein